MSNQKYPRYYLHKGDAFDMNSKLDRSKRATERALKLMKVAYTAVKSRAKQEPEEILLRGGFHNTTLFKGERVKDTRGWHSTISYKLKHHVNGRRHIAGHVYVDSPTSANVTDWQFDEEKDDAAPKAQLKDKPDSNGPDPTTNEDHKKKGREKAKETKPGESQKPAWPDMEQLWGVPDELVCRMHLALSKKTRRNVPSSS
ncbi:hypothetical protein E4U30_007857 [Claviceps sp. LM220 group G6]|nr:hypothetical protein E4U30_007857 [Claviceps sp. LM220 group G6]